MRALPAHVVTQIVEDLVSGAYERVVLQAPNSRVSAADLRQAVEGYGRRLILPPSYELLDFVEVPDASVPTWSVVAPLFTKEEGRSDLSLELTITEVGPAEYRVEVDGLHVL